MNDHYDTNRIKPDTVFAIYFALLIVSVCILAAAFFPPCNADKLLIFIPFGILTVIFGVYSDYLDFTYNKTNTVKWSLLGREKE